MGGRECGCSEGCALLTPPRGPLTLPARPASHSLCLTEHRVPGLQGDAKVRQRQRWSATPAVSRSFPRQAGLRVTLRKEGGQTVLPSARLASLTCLVPQNAAALAHPVTTSCVSSRANTKKVS